MPDLTERAVTAVLLYSDSVRTPPNGRKTDRARPHRTGSSRCFSLLGQCPNSTKRAVPELRRTDRAQHHRTGSARSFTLIRQYPTMEDRNITELRRPDRVRPLPNGQCPQFFVNRTVSDLHRTGSARTSKTRRSPTATGSIVYFAAKNKALKHGSTRVNVCNDDIGIFATCGKLLILLSSEVLHDTL